jgi:hypothetical protein
MMAIKTHSRGVWRFAFEKNNRKPDRPLPSMPVYFDNSKENKTGLSSTWLGHSSVLIHIDGYRVLTDPVFEKKNLSDRAGQI